MEESQLILHVGLPKGGSSALQTALSQTPELTSGTGRQLRYTALRQAGGQQTLLKGRALSLAARRSAYGYATWPNIRPGDADSPVFDWLPKVMEAGRRDGTVPIASCEGWVNQPDLFAAHLQRWGNPRVEVVAFLRPPVDWMNASYWQWGIWNVPSLDLWLRRGNLPYNFGLDLERWAQIPNLRLRLAGARPDVVQKFSALYDVNLPGASSSNSSSPPALIGFLLRNREFRPSGHDASSEFVVQRWCPPVPGRKLWAVQAAHVWALRQAVARNRAALQRIAAAEELEDIFSDARWQDERLYHSEIRLGPSVLDDRAEMAALHDALCEGATRACVAAGLKVPDWPGCPSAAADLDQWDATLRKPMEALLAADRNLRQSQGASFGAALGQRLGLRLARSVRGALPRIFRGA